MTEQLDLLSEPPRRRRMPVEPIVRAAEVENGYRWTLKRAWGAGPVILWCGLNPSIADGNRDDPTIQREIGFSYRWGFGSLVKVNLFPLITPKPAVLRKWLREVNRDAKTDPGQVWPYVKIPYAALGHNHRTISLLIKDDVTCVAAWGKGAEMEEVEDFLADVGLLADTSEHDGFGVVTVPVDWYCLGTNDDGSPRHTLARGAHRIPDDAKLSIWRKANG
jgi:hypothetical protein